MVSDRDLDLKLRIKSIKNDKNMGKYKTNFSHILITLKENWLYEAKTICIVRFIAYVEVKRDNNSTNDKNE